MASVRAWRCIVCGYIHEGATPPAECPVCGAPSEDFEPYEESSGFQGTQDDEVKPPPPGDFRGRIVIVGAGIAGVEAAAAARRRAPEADIVLVGQENALPYYRLNLTRWLAGELNADQLPLHDEAWYREQQIMLLCGRRALRIDSSRRRVELDGGDAMPYDRLILTTGSVPVVPPLPVSDGVPLHTLRTRDDAQNLLEAVSAGAHFLFVGGGILALEAAAGLRRRGAQVTVFERAPWLMPRQLHERAGRLLVEHATAVGIRVQCGAQIRAVQGADREVLLELADGRRHRGTHLVVCAGIRPDASLAQSAGLAVARGILVNESLQTSMPDIYAAGDVAEHAGQLYGIWEPARQQGQVAGENAAGGDSRFLALAPAHTLKVLGTKVFSIGEHDGPDLSLREAEDPAGYAALFLRGDVVVGAVLVGDTAGAAVVERAVRAREAVRHQLDRGLSIREFLAGASVS